MTPKQASPLVLLSLLVFAASAAPAAATPHIQAESASATVTSMDEPVVFHTAAGTTECSLDFHEEDTDTWWPFNDHFSVSSTYTKCKSFGFAEATVSSNGCKYIFRPTEKVSSDNFKAHMDISCPAGKAIEIVAATCAATIGAQSGLTSVDLVNNTGASPKDISITLTVTKFAYTVTKDGFGCPFSGTGSKTDGELSGGGTLTASSGGSAVGIEITGS
jgi:hypothetical protein